MRIGVIAVGRLKDGPERELVRRYLDRAEACGKPLGFTGFDVAEIAESRAGRTRDRMAEEAEALRARAAGAPLICLDERGRDLDSLAFARDLASRRDGGARALAFLIGGADGLDADLVRASGAGLRLGAMTLPHQLARLILAEQLYRAMTILAGHPYHRG